MSNHITCRLCLDYCNEGYCDLYNEEYEMDSGATTATTNEVYDLVKKYFPDELLNMDCSKHLTKLCLQCWHYIEEFHNFQESIILAQSMRMSEHLNTIDEEAAAMAAEETQSIASEIPIKFEQYDISMVNTNEIEEHEEEIEAEEIEVAQDDEMEEGEQGEVLTAAASVAEEDHNYIDENVEDFIIMEAEEDEPDEEATSSNMEMTDNINEIYLDETETETTTTTKIELDNHLYITEIIEHEDKYLKVQQRNVKELQSIEEYDEFIGNWRRHLECDICSDTVETYSMLCDHFMEHHPLDECYINCCDLKLQQRWEIVEHILYHKAADTHKCNICFEKVPNEAMAKQHCHELHPEQISSDVSSPAAARLHGAQPPPGSKRLVKKDKLKIYKCKICDKVFFDNNGLRAHREAEHQQHSDIICTFCPEAFSQFSSYQAHLKTEHQQEWKMKRNQEAIEMLPQIRKHLAGAKLSQKNKTLQQKKAKQGAGDSTECRCPICGNVYHSQRYLRAHLALHGGKATYLCQFCSKVYHLANSLSYHIRLKHSGQTQTVELKCHICGKMYYTKKAYLQHLSMHEGKPSFTCKICSKQYFFSSSLSNHMKYFHAPNQEVVKARSKAAAERRRKRRGPPGSNPLPCHLCTKVYYTKKALDQHLTKHEGKPSFKCKLCSKQYYFSSSFSNHMKYFHAEKKPPVDESVKKAKMLAVINKAMEAGKTLYKCHSCDNVYYSRRTLREHENRHLAQEGSHACKFCSKKYFLKSAMYNHMRSQHNYQPRKDASFKKSPKGKASAKDATTGEQPHMDTLDDLVECLELDQGITPVKQNSKAKAGGGQQQNSAKKTEGLKCSSCDKVYQSKRSLREHEAKHTGEELYACKYCGKKFYLKSTMSTHIKKLHRQGFASTSRVKDEDTTICYDQEQNFAVSAITEEEIDVVTEEVITSTNV